MQSKISKTWTCCRDPITATLAGFVVVAVLLFAIGCGGSESSEESGEQQPNVTEAEELERVAGRWLRPDGGYILELSRSGPEERFKATYLNPRPIRVATTRVSRKNSAVRVYVELLDVGYPGSYYDLVYDRSNDRLIGFYFQAKMNATFDVFFVRADSQ